MVDDPMRSQERSVIAGFALAAVAVAGCAILALVRPQDSDSRRWPWLRPTGWDPMSKPFSSRPDAA